MNNEKNEVKQGERRKKNETYWSNKVSQNSLLIWFEHMTRSFGFRAANHFTTDTHTSLAHLSIYVSLMHFSIRIQTVSPLKSHTWLD